MNNLNISSTQFADTKPHYELLDGLRGVAAILVLIYHIFEGFAFAESTNGEGSGLITTLNHGHIAVDFFFILSGFVISYAYDDRWGKMSLGGFFKRRLIRLHPMLIMGAVVGMISFLLTGCQQWSGEVTPISWVMIALLLTIFMVPALPGLPYEVRGNGEMFPLNGPMWSLFFEYIGNILYALVIRRLSTKLLAVLTAILGVLHAWIFVGDLSGYDSVGIGWTIDTINFWGGLVRMLFPFTMGMLLARTFKPREVKGAFWICSAMLIAVFAVPYIAKSGTISLNSLYEVVCIAVIFPFIVWLGACGKGGDNYTGRINNFLGELSYPLYIVHYPIMYIFYKWLIENRCYTLGDTLGLSALVVLSSVALAYACLKLYDEPVRRWLARKYIQK
ncbi:MAG: acyltransferase [Alistipes sp.]|nr:acyltransferase [Alistipes sp.]MBP3601020.1 acyltransferase [Alistipes sp.]